MKKVSIFGIILSLAFRLFKPRWIVNFNGEMGFRIAGANFWYYKWPDPSVIGTKDGNYEHQREYKIAEKREFGEVVKSRYFQDEES